MRICGGWMIADDKAQTEKFKQAARELGCDEDESRFEEALKMVARHKPPSDAPLDPKKPKPKKPGQ
jgi:hypothetical protein